MPADHRHKIGGDESSLDRQAVAAELRGVAVTQQQQSRERADGFALRRISERVLQFGGLRVDAEHVPADRCRRQRPRQSRPDGCIARAPARTDKGSQRYRRRCSTADLRPSQKMPAVIPRRVLIGLRYFDLGGRKIGRLVAWIDADHHDLKVATGIERQRTEPDGEVLQGQPAQCLAPQIVENQHHRLAGKKSPERHCAALIVDEFRSQRQMRARVRPKREFGEVLTGERTACPARQCQKRQYQHGRGGSHGFPRGKPSIPSSASSRIACSIGMWTTPFFLSIQ